MNTRNARIWVYEDRDRDIVPPFLVGEVAGSLSISADREQLRAFAKTILDWLDKTSSGSTATVHRLVPGNRNVT